MSNKEDEKRKKVEDIARKADELGYRLEPNAVELLGFYIHLSEYQTMGLRPSDVLKLKPFEGRSGRLIFIPSPLN